MVRKRKFSRREKRLIVAGANRLWGKRFDHLGRKRGLSKAFKLSWMAHKGGRG